MKQPTSNMENAFLLGGEMGRLMRTIDWSQTRLGPIEQWPQSLQTAVSICLCSPFPMVVLWGPELVSIYNDNYRPMFAATKHPKALGQPAKAIWVEIWDMVGSLLEGVYKEGKSIWFDDQMMPLQRHGYTEEAYFTYSYSPIFDETGGIGGVLAIGTETTRQVIGERRLKMLRELGDKTSNAQTVSDVCESVINMLKTDPDDVPFALLYLFDEGTSQIQKMGQTGLPQTLLENGQRLGRLTEVIEGQKPILIEGLTAQWESGTIGPGTETPDKALALPLLPATDQSAIGVLVMGVSTRLALDEGYLDFFQLVSSQVTSAILASRAYEAEYRRAEMLAELDQAKTKFFSNVSHEFRTPLTLMLNPIQDLVGGVLGSLTPQQQEALQIAQRNSLRLLKLVNTLLDFSRIQSGRIERAFIATDLSTLTADLASGFRSVIEQAGLRFTVDCPPLEQPVYLDPEMWEKIVLNLISNAFKFTFEGEIAVTLYAQDNHVELTVRDTGVGIAEAELPHLFKRFHRVQGARSRTYEGSGIGLALVKELVNLLHGEVEVTSQLEQGTTFKVRIPLGHTHLSSEQLEQPLPLVSTAVGATPYIQEALSWFTHPLLSSASSDVPQEVELSSLEFSGAAILIADDNADMRSYLRRLLEPYYQIEIAVDGKEALAHMQRRKPDLILADVMMPHLDGFELLRELRKHEQTAAVPVILLSAQAGEEAKIAGLQRGANDYLIKPFSPRELLARVQTQLQITRLREQLLLQEKQTRLSVEQNNITLTEMNQQLEAFTYMVSHDLGTPLRALKGLSNILIEDYGEALDETASAYLHRIAAVAQNMEELLRNLLTYSRLNQLELELQPIPLNKVIEEVVLQLNFEVHERKATITIEKPLLAVKAQRTLLDQILTNLIHNAMKFVAPGIEPHIRIYNERRGQFMRLYVEDNGIGIPAEYQEQIFRLFERLHTVEKYQGTGVGLAIVARSVERMGGQVGVEAVKEKGSRFWIELPYVEEGQE